MKTTDEILEAMWMAVLCTANNVENGDSVKRKWKRIFKKHGIDKPSRVVVKLGNGHWLCSSDSRPGDFHSIEYVGESDYVCSCEDHACRKRQCKHIDVIREVEQHV